MNKTVFVVYPVLHQISIDSEINLLPEKFSLTVQASLVPELQAGS